MSERWRGMVEQNKERRIASLDSIKQEAYFDGYNDAIKDVWELVNRIKEEKQLNETTNSTQDSAG